MLAQLVCIDRRYQRMNCFNMREIQALLKKKFFPEIIDDRLFNVIFNETSINLKNKLNNLSSVQNNKSIIIRYGIRSNFESVRIIFILKSKMKETILLFIRNRSDYFVNISRIHI